jgi:hypothetical protein
MPTDVMTLVEQFVQKLMGDHATAAQYAADPQGTLAANGIADQNLDGVNMHQIVGRVCGGMDLPEGTQHALQQYSERPYHEGAHQSVHQIIQDINYVTKVTYQDDHSIHQQIDDHSTNIDNSVDLDVHGDVYGDISVDSHNANATGAGSVANSGDGDVVAATGSHSQAVGGNNTGQMNTGDGASQVGGSNEGSINTGTNTGVMTGKDGHVDHTVVGDHNNTANVEGSNDGGVINFGGGHVNNASNNDVHDGAVSAGGNATNVSHVTQDHGSALSVGGNASGNDNHYDDNSYHDNSQHDYSTHDSHDDINADHSNVNTAHDHSHATQHASADTDVDVHLEEPVHEVHPIN